MMWKKQLTKKNLFTLFVLFLGLIITSWIYFKPSSYADTAIIVNKNLNDRVTEKTEDEYKNYDEKRVQTLKLKVISGKHQGKIYTVKNHYVKSQLETQAYRSGERVLVSFNKGQISLLSPKRDWILALAATIVLTLLLVIAGKNTFWLVLSLVLSWIIFYIIIKFDIQENGTEIFAIYGLGVIVFAFVSLLIVQGLNKKMLATYFATLVGVFVSFGICYLIMKLTGEAGMKYETVDYATQSPRSLFLAQALLGVLGAVMDEATDIVSSLYELTQHKKDLTVKQLLLSGRTMGQEIMGPLINVLVLIFIAEALPMTILYLRDNNTLAFSFEFTLSLGAIQSLMSAIGICLTVIFASLTSLVFLKKRGD